MEFFAFDNVRTPRKSLILRRRFRIISWCRQLYLLMKSQEARLPDKPFWYHRLDEAIEQLENLPDPFLDRATLEFALGIGRRRAQQILQPLVRRTVGKNGLAAKEDVIAWLRRLAEGEAAFFEKKRRQRLGDILGRLQAEAQRPRVLVEAPTAIVNQELDSLPPGVHLAPGRILIEAFRTPEEAQRKLLALAMAMANDPLGFAARITAHH